jgi:hypothetical protein
MRRLVPVAERDIHPEEDDVAGLRIGEDAAEREPGEGIEKAARHRQQTGNRQRLLRRDGSHLPCGNQLPRCGFHRHHHDPAISSRRDAGWRRRRTHSPRSERLG